MQTTDSCDAGGLYRREEHAALDVAGAQECEGGPIPMRCPSSRTFRRQSRAYNIASDRQQSTMSKPDEVLAGGWQTSFEIVATLAPRPAFPTRSA